MNGVEMVYEGEALGIIKDKTEAIISIEAKAMNLNRRGFKNFVGNGTTHPDVGVVTTIRWAHTTTGRLDKVTAFERDNSLISADLDCFNNGFRAYAGDGRGFRPQPTVDFSNSFAIVYRRVHRHHITQ